MTKNIKNKITGVLLSALIAISAITACNIPASAATYTTTARLMKNSSAFSIKNQKYETRPNGFRVSFDVKTSYPIAIRIERDDAEHAVRKLITGMSKKKYRHVNVTIPVTHKGPYRVYIGYIDEDADYMYNVMYSGIINYSGRTDYLSRDSVVQKYAPADRKAKALAKGISSDKKKVEIIHKWIRQNFTYDEAKSQLDPAETYMRLYKWDQSVKKTFTTRKGVCIDMAIMETSMLRSLGIKADVVSSYDHSWVKAKIDGTWRYMDPSADALLKDSGGSVTFFDPNDTHIWGDIYQRDGDEELDG